MTARSGLVFAISSDPAPGEDVGGDFSPVFHEAEIDVENLRAIGDAAPGDERTSIASLEVEWEEEDMVYVRFTQAPPGLYSQLLGEIVSYEISGTVVVNSETKEFRVRESSASIGFSSSLSEVNLEPNMVLEVPVEVKLRGVIHAIDWANTPVDEEGTLVVDESSERISEVHGKLKEAFEAAAPNPL